MGGASWQLLVAPEAACALSLGLAALVGFGLDRKSREWLRLGTEPAIASLRGTIIATPRDAASPEQIVTRSVPI